MFDKLLAKIAKSLDNKNIPYMIIGGQAVLLYGLPRLTEDIDITLGVDVERLGDVLEAGMAAGLKRVSGADDEFIRRTNVLICQDAKTGVRVDYIFSYILYEREAIKRSRKIKIGRQKVNFASCEDVIIHKIFAARPRDLEDAEVILAKHVVSLDLDYIRNWLKEFSGMPEHKDVLANFELMLKKIKD